MNGAEVERMLRTLNLDAMAASFAMQNGNRAFDDLSREEIIANMCQAQLQAITDRRLSNMTRQARFRFNAQPEDFIWDVSRGLDKAAVRALFNGDWVKRGENLLLSGSTGTGKSWIACAIGLAVVRAGYSVLYTSTKSLLEEMRMAHIDRTIGKYRKNILNKKLLLLDDFGIHSIPEASKSDLFDVLEMRCDVGATMIIGQLAPSEWHSYLDTSHMADAMMDRMLQRAHIIALKGPSLRKRL